MFKIQNSELEGEEKGIYLAASGIYEIIKIERIIMAAVSTFKPAEIEERFNNCVQTAMNNYTAFCSDVQLHPSELEIELLTNFIELFELVIDIKKTEAEKSGAAIVAAAAAEKSSAAAVAAIVAAAAVEHESQPPKAKRAKKTE